MDESENFIVSTYYDRHVLNITTSNSAKPSEESPSFKGDPMNRPNDSEKKSITLRSYSVNAINSVRYCDFYCVYINKGETPYFLTNKECQERK